MIIYQITNSINKKRYIGKTSKSIEERFARHLKSSRLGGPWAISRAIRKYGEKQFKIELKVKRPLLGGDCGLKLRVM